MIPAFQLSLRAAVAAGVALIAAQLLQLQHPLYAMISAVIVTDLVAARTPAPVSFGAEQNPFLAAVPTALDSTAAASASASVSAASAEVPVAETPVAEPPVAQAPVTAAPATEPAGTPTPADPGRSPVSG